MAWPSRGYFDQLIHLIRQYLRSERIVRYEIGEQRALFDIESLWDTYRIVLSEIHRPDGSRRYAYYVLDNGNQLIVGFDNSADAQAIRLRYGDEWRQHIHEEIPHTHDVNRQIRLTDEMTVQRFFEWLQTELQKTTTQ